MEKKLNEIKQLIINGLTRKALDKLLDVVSEDDSIIVYGFHAEFNNTKKKELQGIVKVEEIDNDFRKLNKKILDLIIEIERKKQNKSSFISSENNNNSNHINYNIANLVDLLTKSRKFTKKSIFEFCQKTKGFSELRLRISPKMQRKVLAYELVMFAEDNNLEKPLLEWVNKVGSTEFEKYGIVGKDGEDTSYIQEVYSFIKKCKEFLPPEKKPIILISGSTGTGKSSTINKIVGKEIAKVGHISVGTITDSRYEFTIKDENIDFIDVPGLGQSKSTDIRYRDIYQKWAEKAHAFIVVVNPPRPASDPTLETIKVLLESGVNPKKIIFGLNKVGTLRYNDSSGINQVVSVNNLMGPNPYELQKVEKLKVQFLNDLNNQISSYDFSIDQVVAYDAITGWNIQRLLKVVFHVLPISTIIIQGKLIKDLTDSLNQHTLTENERKKIEDEQNKLANQIASRVFNWLSKTAGKINKKWGPTLEKKLAKPKGFFTKFTKSSIKFLEDINKILEGDNKEKKEE